MPLSTGARLGVYEVVGLLGVGGMGEVYRAVDTRLDRQVAIKVLPEAVRADPERVARFEREAKLLASLNHSNIAGIYGLEQANGEQFIVMELVEGPNLADRIAEGPIPVDEALQIAKQISRARGGTRVTSSPRCSAGSRSRWPRPGRFSSCRLHSTPSGG